MKCDSLWVTHIGQQSGWQSFITGHNFVCTALIPYTAAIVS